MLRFRFILYVTLLIRCIGFAQNDSSLYFPEKPIKEGIFLTYEDFRNSRSIPKEQLISDKNRERVEFISKTLLQEKFSYRVNETIVTVESKRVWGFYQGNTFYINYNGEFYRIPVFGSICFLVANVKVVSPSVYDPRFGYIGSVSTTETREFIMNFYEGNITEFTQYKVETLLSRDKQIYEEFKKLSRRKQKQQTYRYIRKYNEAHPVYFLIEKPQR